VPASPVSVRRTPGLRCFAPAIILRPRTCWPASNRITPCRPRAWPPGRDHHDRGAHARSLTDLQAPQTRSAGITGQIREPHLPHQGGRHQIREGQCGVVQLRRPKHAHEARLSCSHTDARGPRRAADRTHGDDAGPDAEDDRIRLGAAVYETGRNLS